jgi:hypothetical protein
VSAAATVELVRQAKKRGLCVTAETCPHYFSLTEDALKGLDANFKMNPPLRSLRDLEAIREGLADGTLDAIASDHAPHPAALKARGLALAPFGVIGLETLLSATLTFLVHKGHLAPLEAVRRLSDQIAEELNVQTVEVLRETSRVAEGRVAFNAKTYGRAFGRDVPELVREVAALEPESLPAGEQVAVGRWQVPRAALSVDYQPKPGYAVAHEAGYLVALDTEVTPELAAAGLARELVHRLQTMRRSAGFDIADSIETFYQGDEEVARVLAEHGEYVRQETLSRRLEPGDAPDGYSEEHRVDGHVVKLTVRKVS